MESIRRFRRDAHPLAVLGAYVGLQTLFLGIVALPGGYDFELSGTQLALELVLVLFVARGSHLAWSLLLAWEVFGAALMLLFPFVIAPTSAGQALVAAGLVAVSLLSLWLVWSPALRASVGDRKPVSA